MIFEHKLLKPAGMLLGAAGVNVATITTVSNSFASAGSCSGSCGACGFGCLSSIIGIAIGGTTLAAVKKFKIVNKIQAAFPKVSK